MFRTVPFVQGRNWHRLLNTLCHASSNTHSHTHLTLANLIVMDPPQQCEVHFPANASATADAPWSATAFPPPTPQHPLPTESTPSSYRRPVPAQPPRSHASVVPDAVVSDWFPGIPPLHLRRSYMPSVFSSHRRTLPAIIVWMRTGSICPHPLKTPLHWVKHKTCDAVTWPITLWLMITPRFTSITAMLSTTMPGLL